MAETELLNARLDSALVERARNAVWHIGRGKTLTGLVRDGFQAEVAKLEEEYNGGKPFPQRSGELPKSGKKKTEPPTAAPLDEIKKKVPRRKRS